MIASPTGEIEGARVGYLFSLVAAVAALGMLLALAFTNWVTNPEAVETAVWAGMTPITGAQVASAITGRLASKRIQSGAAPGRRVSDTAERPIDGGNNGA